MYYCEYVVFWVFVYDCVLDGVVEEIFCYRIFNENFVWFVVWICVVLVFCRIVVMDVFIVKD